MQHFNAKVDGVDAIELGLMGKPDPVIFLEAAKRLGVKPERTAIVEDSLAGIEAGRRGGFKLVIGVDRAGHAAELKERGANVVVRDLAELRVHGIDSPSHLQATTKVAQDLPSALHRKKEIFHRLHQGRPVLFLDYDGTLTPIVNDPAQAVLPNKTREVVKRLAQRYPVAVVSGRDLTDVRDMVGVKDILYVGSHGFDIAGSGGSIQREEPRLWTLSALDRAEAKLRTSLRIVPSGEA